MRTVYTETHVQRLALIGIANGKPNRTETENEIIGNAVDSLVNELGTRPFADMLDWFLARRFTEDQLRAMVLPGHEGKDLRMATAAALNADPVAASTAIARLLQVITGVHNVAVLREGDRIPGVVTR